MDFVKHTLVLISDASDVSGIFRTISLPSKAASFRGLFGLSQVNSPSPMDLP